MNIKEELLRLRFSFQFCLIGVVAAILGLAQASLLVLAGPLISGLQALNGAIPNATDVDRLSADQVSQLTIAAKPMQLAVISPSGGNAMTPGMVTVLVCLAAALTIATEFRRESIMESVTASPSRTKLFANKCFALLLTVGVFSLALAVVKILILASGAVAQRVPLLVSLPEVLSTIAVSCAALLFATLLGAGIGFLVQSPVGVCVLIIGASYVEFGARALGVMVWPGSFTPANFLPFAAVDAAWSSGSVEALFPGLASTSTLSLGVALAIAVAWAIALGALGWRRFERQDLAARA